LSIEKLGQTGIKTALALKGGVESKGWKNGKKLEKPGKIKKIKKRELDFCLSVSQYLELGLPVLGQAVAAVYRASLSGLERHFALCTTVGACGLCHFTGSEAASAVSVSITHFIHLLFRALRLITNA